MLLSGRYSGYEQTGMRVIMLPKTPESKAKSSEHVVEMQEEIFGSFFKLCTDLCEMFILWQDLEQSPILTLSV